MKRISTLILACVMVLALLLTSCGEPADNSSTNVVDPASVSGTVKYCYPSWGGTLEEDEAAKAFAKMKELYPNITIESYRWIGWEGLTNYLTTMAASKDFPDLIEGWDNVPYFITQGWIQPITDLLAADEEAQYIPKSVNDAFTYNGEIYGTAFDVIWRGIVVNLDMLEAMNEDMPSYEWTYDEFLRLAKKATTDTTSGINHIWDIENRFALANSETLWENYFDPVANKYDFTSGAWVEAINQVKELKSISGLVSDDMINQELRDAGQLDDYQKKFGKDADAIDLGKVLFILDGTQEKGGWHMWLPYNWDYLPMPIDAEVGYRNSMCLNYVLMSSTVSEENRQAAFEILKYNTFGTEGIINRLDDAYAKTNDLGDPLPHSVPVSIHPDVVAKLEQSPSIKPGELWMYKNFAKSASGDTAKFGIDMTSVINEQIDPIREQLLDGSIDPASVAKDIEDKVNAAYRTMYAELEAALKK